MKGKLNVVSDVVVGTVSAHVTKIMTCTETWLAMFYYVPMVEILAVVEKANQEA